MSNPEIQFAQLKKIVIVSMKSYFVSSSKQIWYLYYFNHCINENNTMSLFKQIKHFKDLFSI